MEHKRTNYSSGAPLEEKVGYSRMVKIDDQVFIGGTTSVQPDGSVYGETAYEQALERQLGGDAQVEVAVKGVEVGDEGLGVGAAEDGVHHGGLDLHVAVGLHVAADQADDLAALAEGVRVPKATFSPW